MFRQIHLQKIAANEPAVKSVFRKELNGVLNLLSGNIYSADTASHSGERHQISPFSTSYFKHLVQFSYLAESADVFSEVFA